MKLLLPTHIFRPLLISLLAVTMLATSCVENTGLRGKTTKTGSSLTDSEDEDEDDTDTDTTTPQLQSVKVELSHLVDPFDGTYKKKVTIPKNFTGNIYLAGLNVSALSDKLIKVRFKYGLDNQEVVLNATVARAPGIIPQTDIQVLVVNMNSRPFNKMRLNYDLFDYNDYSDAGKEPVTNPRDSGLYCRGLQVADDPTTTRQGECSLASDQCLYSYAKITDTTLYNTVTNITSIPTRPQVWSMVSGVRSPTIASSAGTMCLPDTNNKDALNSLYDLSLTGLTYPTSVLGMYYKGPYRAINGAGWAIQGEAIFNASKGLFQVKNLPDTYTGYKSFLFPRAGKLSLQQDARYMGSSDRFGAGPIRSVQSATASIDTQYVDGCNLRAMNYNPATTEGMGSCNVNGSIEVFYMKGTTEMPITTDKSIKLQIVRASVTDFEGKEVLTSAFKRCENSTTCGAGECCYNSRCWSKDLVSQCIDTLPTIGNLDVGANCGSDYECSSLCCNSNTGTCSPHVTTGGSPILCSKSAGQSCVSREFCQKQYISVCKIVKTTKIDGTPSCTRKCDPVETFSSCISGKCVPPTQPTPPAFDPDNPDCTGAVDP